MPLTVTFRFDRLSTVATSGTGTVTGGRRRRSRKKDRCGNRSHVIEPVTTSIVRTVAIAGVTSRHSCLLSPTAALPRR